MKNTILTTALLLLVSSLASARSLNSNTASGIQASAFKDIEQAVISQCLESSSENNSDCGQQVQIQKLKTSTEASAFVDMEQASSKRLMDHAKFSNDSKAIQQAIDSAADPGAK